MATATGKKLYTAQQFMAMEFGDGLYELVQGELVKLSPPLHVHAVICGRITTILGVYGTTSGFGYVLSGEAAVWTTRNPDTVRGADLAFYSHARLPLKPENPPLPEIAPDVVVEILSPSNRPAEMLQKVSEYISAGVSLVWLVSPTQRSVTLYRSAERGTVTYQETDTLENLPELPGFTCPVSRFFF